MNRGRAQILSAIAIFVAFPVSIIAQLTAGDIRRIDLVDVDGNTLSTADGRITVIALTSRSNIDKARLVGDRIPDFCLANPNYRMITVLVFEKNHSKPIRAIMSAMVRRRLDSEGRRLQSRYQQLKIVRDARRDVFAVTDFDGAIATQLDSKPNPSLFQVFVFGRNGELIKQWSDVPSSEELVAVLKRD